MPLFAIVCTKFKRDAVAVNDTILEVAVNSEALERMKSVEDTLEAVKSVQVSVNCRRPSSILVFTRNAVLLLKRIEILNFVFLREMNLFP